MTKIPKCLPGLTLGILSCASLAATAAGAGSASCEGLVTGSARYAVKPVGKPPFMKRYRDPAFGTTVMRITDVGAGGVLKPAYSTVQAWNADESRLILYRAGKDPGHVLFDGRTYEPIEELPIVPADIEEVFWSHTDPNVFFYVSKYAKDIGDFLRYDIESGTATKIRDFRKWCGPRGVPTAGGDAHMPSLDDDLFGFRCRNEDGDWTMLSYRISTDEVFAAPVGDGTDFDEWTAPTPAPSGERFWMQGRTLSVDLKTVEATMDMAKPGEHSNVGLDADGSDALFQAVYDPSPEGCVGGDPWRGVGHLTEHLLATGECRPVITRSEGFPYTTSGTHVSAQAWKKPGRVAMSSVGYDQFEWFTGERKAPALFSEIYIADTGAGERVVCRLAQHRSYGKDATHGGYAAYFGEPHATISPSGTRVLFGSDWYDSGSVDAYVVELPGFER